MPIPPCLRVCCRASCTLRPYAIDLREPVVHACEEALDTRTFVTKNRGGTYLSVTGSRVNLSAINAHDYFLIDSAFIAQSGGLSLAAPFGPTPLSSPACSSHTLPLTLSTPSQLLDLFTRKRTEMPHRDPF